MAQFALRILQYEIHTAVGFVFLPIKFGYVKNIIFNSLSI